MSSVNFWARVRTCRGRVARAFDRADIANLVEVPRPCVLCKGGYDAADIAGFIRARKVCALAVRIICTLSVEGRSDEVLCSSLGWCKQ